MNPEIIIGNNIKRKREEQGVKIESLGKAIGITKGRMSQIESGACKELTINRITKIAGYLKIDFFEIISQQPQTVNINNSENSSGFYGKHYNFSPEAIISIVDELVSRMKH